MKNNSIRILHLGLGRFHRGHQCVYYQKMSELFDDKWGVASLSMRSREARDQLRSVNLKFPVVETSAYDNKLAWMDCIEEALSAQDDSARVMEIFTSKNLEIITLTVTEKGYCLNPQGKLDRENPAIVHDLKNHTNPQSAIGLLALGFKNRRVAGGSGLTVVSCDNLRGNGDKLKAAISEYLEMILLKNDLDWMNSHVTFPNTMVDRIVPSLTSEKTSEFENIYGLCNSEIIATEGFSQWIIEDKFSGKRPAWDKVGVEFVKDVRPYEELKLRLLNASHSYLAYAGLNKGYQFVHEAIGDHELRQNVMNLMFNEVAPILQIPAGFDVKNYGNKIIARFENFKLPHQLKQIAMDGSQKLPQRIFSSIMTSYERGSPRITLVLAVTEWLNYCWNMISKDRAIDDPMCIKMTSIMAQDKSEWATQMIEGDLFNYLHGLKEFKNEVLQTMRLKY